MQLRVETTSSRQNFTGIKMTAANRADGTRLLEEYLKEPSLKTRDKIFC